MAKNETKRLNAEELTEDVKNVATLNALADYTPNNQNYTAAKVGAAHTAMQGARDAEKKALNAAYAARDNATAAEWALHNLMLGVKDQVKSQYGADSNELQGFGIKKKSERKSPGPKKTKTTE